MHHRQQGNVPGWHDSGLGVFRANQRQRCTRIDLVRPTACQGQGPLCRDVSDGGRSKTDRMDDRIHFGLQERGLRQRETYALAGEQALKSTLILSQIFKSTRILALCSNWRAEADNSMVERLSNGFAPKALLYSGAFLKRRCTAQFW